jgi:hypothetical protein
MMNRKVREPGSSDSCHVTFPNSKSYWSHQTHTIRTRSAVEGDTFIHRRGTSSSTKSEYLSQRGCKGGVRGEMTGPAGTVAFKVVLARPKPPPPPLSLGKAPRSQA